MSLGPVLGPPVAVRPFKLTVARTKLLSLVNEGRVISWRVTGGQAVSLYCEAANKTAGKRPPINVLTPRLHVLVQ